MLIQSYELDVFTPPCDPGAEGFAAVGHLTVDIRHVLPYLNATLRGAVYTESVHSLTWKKAGHNVAFHADRIAVSNVEDREQAIRELDGLVELVNRTWERRSDLTPDSSSRQRPTAMAIYKLLPATNPQGAFGSCRKCGSSSCWNFALKLVAAQVELDKCPLIAKPAHAGRQSELRTLLGQMPALGPRDR